MNKLQKVTPSLRQIIDVFKNHQFTDLTLQLIAKELDQKENTINQRIIRDDNYFFQSRSTKPKIIILNVYRLEILTYIFKNQCQICRVKKPIGELNVIYRDHNKANKNISNLQLICEKCRYADELEFAEERRKKIIKVLNTKQKNQLRYEYKTIQIRSQDLSNIRYYEYNEEDYNQFPVNDWYYLKDSNDNIISFTLTSILDFFGEEGWELVNYTDLNFRNAFHALIAKSDFIPNYNPRFDFFQCIFKRRDPK